ncbi:hypothetical protein MFRU_004g01550 [Monilinia fructicola]|nr:hypothetical protein MFRU_004g01550 [Monilinia fructicola]
MGDAGRCTAEVMERGNKVKNGEWGYFLLSNAALLVIMMLIVMGRQVKDQDKKSKRLLTTEQEFDIFS